MSIPYDRRLMSYSPPQLSTNERFASSITVLNAVVLKNATSDNCYLLVGDKLRLVH